MGLQSLDLTTTSARAEGSTAFLQHGGGGGTAGERDRAKPEHSEVQAQQPEAPTVSSLCRIKTGMTSLEFGADQASLPTNQANSEKPAFQQTQGSGRLYYLL